MTLTDEIKILDDNIKVNQAEYDLDREAAKMPALLSKELDKYEYLIEEDLGYKPGIVQRDKFEYSVLGEVLSGKVKKDKQNNKTDKRIKKDKQEKNLFYNSQHSFVKFKDVSDFKYLSLDSMPKKPNDFFIKNLLCLKNLIRKQKKSKI